MSNKNQLFLDLICLFSQTGKQDTTRMPFEEKLLDLSQFTDSELLKVLYLDFKSFQKQIHTDFARLEKSSEDKISQIENRLTMLEKESLLEQGANKRNHLNRELIAWIISVMLGLATMASVYTAYHKETVSVDHLQRLEEKLEDLKKGG